MASSFRGASYTKPFNGVLRTLSYIQDGAFAKKVNDFKYFCQKARCLTGVLPRKSVKVQLLNELFEIVHKFVNLIFFQNRCRPLSNFKHLKQRGFFRSSRSQIFFKISVPKNFANFTGKRLCWSVFLIHLQALGLQLYQKETPTQVFSCEICETFKSIYFYRTPPVAAILVIIFWNFLMFYQIFLSPQMKRIVIISDKHGIYELPHELPNDLRLEIRKY